MTEKLYYWAENLENYSSDNEQDYDQIIEIKRLNFFIGKNNAGKSRFLRTLFKSNYPSGIYGKIELIKNINLLKEKTPNIDNTLGYSTVHSDIKHHLSDIIKNLSINNANALIYLNSSINQVIENNKNIREYFKNYQLFELDEADINLITKLFLNRYHIPVLRGMRPVTEIENKQPYIERAQKDYFEDKSLFNASNIITGECLFHELKVHLLGKPKQRETIKLYEEKLGQYFFDNQQITLIPMFGKDKNGKENDVVHIKIGDEEQFPIFELGDGLQQVIILTYEAFIKNYDEQGNEQTHAFFIEEPELHMHAGMVRQLMNFYLNETKHYYFFTTHSNHLLDMADESDQVIIQKFVKEQKKENSTKFDFKIKRCDRDRDLLASLGVKPSSVYLANCTIWVEGITDRLYITKYMEKYLADLEKTKTEKYKKYRRFMPNYHYTFVEYAGSNLVHWSFSDNYADHLDNKGLSAKAVASEMLLIADGDIQNKADRVEVLQSELNTENYFILPCKETENTLPFNVIIRIAKPRFERMNSETKEGYDIELINNISDQNYFDNTEYGIGRLLDSAIKIADQNPTKNPFADGSGVGTIKKKLDFCREIINDFDENPDWQLTQKAKELCERIFQHIEKCNS